MIARYNNRSLALGVPGLILQVVGRVMMQQSPDGGGMGILVSLVGTGMLIAGLSFYALAKGRSAFWGLMGFLSIIGLIVLALLKDRAPNG